MKIQILPPADARRIAAGEVIDRPGSALRELLDNAIDSGAGEISIFIEQGGIKSLIVSDNGCGMEEEDLAKSILPHATSKINSVDDLQKIYSLGFRGEALASLAACSFLEIKSKTKEGDSWLLSASDSKVNQIIPSPAPEGTWVKVSELFYNLTARRRFLKGAGAETRECQNTFFEKAMAFPDRTFKFYTDGQLKFHYPKGSRLDRVTQIFGKELGVNPHFIANHYNLEQDGFTLDIVAADPSVYRGDRRYIQVYINGRRIMEFGLIQAVLYAYSTVLPAGQYPLAFVFITVRADLADFNIHPAKREAKLHNLQMLHKVIVHEISSVVSPVAVSVKETFRPSMQTSLSLEYARTTEDISLVKEKNKRDINLKSISDDEAFRGLSDREKKSVIKTNNQPLSSTPTQGEETPALWHYLGQLMGVFLLVEWEETLYLIDQHAAHERILFNEYSKRTAQTSQRLLHPIAVDVTEEERSALMLNRHDFMENGIEIEAADQTTIHITACPDYLDRMFWHDYIKEYNPSLKKDLFARMACRAAIKEGEFMDKTAAEKLIEATFALPEPFCPHGRPVWVEISRDQLYKWVKRIV